MKNCGNCANYDRMKEAYTDVCGKCFLSSVNKLEAPSQWKPLPKTNADRIRAELENDEELAALYVRYNPDTHMYHTDAGAFTDFVAAMEAELEWLQQPAEGE